MASILSQPQCVKAAIQSSLTSSKYHKDHHMGECLWYPQTSPLLVGCDDEHGDGGRDGAQRVTHLRHVEPYCKTGIGKDLTRSESTLAQVM